ncbi:MAG: hypothetical protein ACR2KE_05565 [Candidatus Nanopelagicales bacterium]
MTRRLSAGPLRLDYDNGDLRAIRVGDLEIVRRIYVAFQDRNWSARPWHVEEEEVESTGDGFRIRVRARGSFDARHFTWEGDFTGDADGTITYAIDGSTTEPFLRNRLGICLLHPMDRFAGRPCVVTTDEDTVEAAFPVSISPHQPFLGIRAMEFPTVDGARARLDFAGEVFETEDHRNWGDASYKTYCTPIALPFPVEVRPGDRVAQSVTLRLSGPAPEPVEPAEAVTITVSADPMPLPGIGTQVTGLPWTDGEMAAVRALDLDHLMATVDAAAEDASDDLAGVIEAANRLGVPLRLRLANGDEAAYARLRDAVRAAPLQSLAVIRDDEKVTSSASTAIARDALGEDLPWCVGTDLYFTELNRQPPDTTGASWVSFSMNPQVHASDDRSVLQNAATLAAIAAEAPRLSGSARIAAGPISLRPRFNPNATDPASDVSNNDLPSAVDARQRTWLAAVWTALSLRSLAAPGTVDAVTYFEAVGWRGLRERDAGSADPVAFPSSPREEFPVYALLRALAGYPDLLPTASAQPEVADALVVTGPDGSRAFVVNMSPVPRIIVLSGAMSATIEAAPQSIAIIDLDRRTP